VKAFRRNTIRPRQVARLVKGLNDSKRLNHYKKYNYMPDLNSSAVNSFIETVKNGAEEAVSSFFRTFGVQITIQPNTGGHFQFDTITELNGKGLAMLLVVGGQGIAILIPAATGLVPPWCDNPDATGKSKLSTFAQEWGMNLVPEDFFPEDFQAAVLQNLAEGVRRAQPDWEAGYLELSIGKSDGTTVTISMVWPFAEYGKLFEEQKTEEIPSAPGLPTFGGDAPNFIGQGSPTFDSFPNENFSGQQRVKHRSVDDLPGYSRSILKVKIPVAAVLAESRKPIKTILELGVGSVIQFDKSCDELLNIEVGQTTTIAVAEAVKVGDKFGFRINTILLPKERFRKVEVRREGEYRVKHDIPQLIGKAPIKSLEKH
jgi:flagellar motor switch protein FliN/FliY